MFFKDIRQPLGDSNTKVSRGIIVPWGLLDLIHGLVVLTVASLVVLVIFHFGKTTQEPRMLAPLTSFLLVTLPAILVYTAWLFGIRRYKTKYSKLGLIKTNRSIILILSPAILFTSILLTTSYTILIRAIGWDDALPPNVHPELIGDGLYRIINTISIGLLGPFAEEVFFRGFLLNGLIRYTGIPSAILISSFIFAISHGDISLIIPVFMSGVVLASAYVKTGSLLPSFVAHSAQNLLALTTMT